MNAAARLRLTGLLLLLVALADRLPAGEAGPAPRAPQPGEWAEWLVSPATPADADPTPSGNCKYRLTVLQVAGERATLRTQLAWNGQTRSFTQADFDLGRQLAGLDGRLEPDCQVGHAPLKIGDRTFAATTYTWLIRRGQKQVGVELWLIDEIGCGPARLRLDGKDFLIAVGFGRGEEPAFPLPEVAPKPMPAKPTAPGK